MSDPFDPDALDLPEEPEPRPRTAGSDVEQMLRRLHDVVASARPMPLSTSVMVNRDEVLDLLDETIERLPDELRAARWLLKEREEYLAKVKREGEDILDQARTRAERMVQRTEIVKASEARARKIVDAATDEAARLRNEVEDFCDQKLASFEIVLERTLKMVGAGRQKLQVSLNTGEVPAVGSRPDEDTPEGPAVYDQDLG
jgi:cell division septum initiation protein DivIVA